MPIRTALVLVAKEPDLERTKTRLAPRLSPEARLALCEAMLLDKRDQLAGIDRVARVLAFDPPTCGEAMARRMGEGWTLIAQGDGDLGARMHRVGSALLGEGYASVIFVGSDSPTLPIERVIEARDALERAERDAVIGPAEDGGYYLIGVRRSEPALFAGIEWSTERVFEQQMSALRALRARTRVLGSSYDVDVPSDLDRLARELNESEALRAAAPRTARFCASALAERAPPVDNQRR